MLLFLLAFHCHVIYSAVVEMVTAAKNGTENVNGTAHDYPDYDPSWRPEPTESTRSLDYESLPTQPSQPSRRYPQLVAVPDLSMPMYPMERTALPPPYAQMGAVGHPDYGMPRTYPSNGMNGGGMMSGMNEFRRRNAMVMGNPRMRYRPQMFRTNNNPYSQIQSGYASLGYSYGGYIERQARRFPIMMYTLVQCVPCQRAKHLLAVSYSDSAAHFLELVGGEDWQRQLRADLHRMTGQETFPYIFICGSHIGGASNLFELHQSGQLRTMLNNCTPRN